MTEYPILEHKGYMGWPNAAMIDFSTRALSIPAIRLPIALRQTMKR